MDKVRMVLDASVAVAWSMEDEADPYPEFVLDALEEGIVPGIWPLEVANALLVAERRGRLTRADVEQFLSFLQALPITVETDVVGRAFGEVLALAREQGLSVYDAAYLNLAMRHGLPLATQDQALRKAADRCGVEVFKTG